MKQQTLSIIPRPFLAMGIAAIALFGASAPAVRADSPGAHPLYLHAIADLRAARAYLSTGDEQNVEQNKGAAIIEIDQAVSAIRQAAWNDKKNPRVPRPIDARLSHLDRFSRALALLNRAHQDLDRPESNQGNMHLRGTAFAHVDRAIQDVHQAIRDDQHDDQHGDKHGNQHTH